MDTNRDELVERYLDGEATKKEIASLKALMQQDANFKKEVATQRLMKGVLRSEDKLAFEKELGKLSEELLTPKLGQHKKENSTHQNMGDKKAKTRRLFPPQFALAIAAAITLIIVAVVVFQGTPNQELYTAYYQPFSLKNVRGENTEDLKAQIGSAYNKADYAQAKQLLQKYLKQTTEKPDRFELALANCYLNLNDTEKAIALFQSISTRETGGYAQDAEWFLALAYLKVEDEQNMNRILTDITSNSNHIYYDYALKLQKAL